MGAVALGVHPYSIQTGYIDTSLFLLFGATTFWTIIYDCIYGFQDLKDDLREGILSMPVLFQYNIKPVFWALVLSITASLTAVGYQNGMSLLYYLITPGGTTLCLGLMVANVDLSSSASCWWWFAKGFWYVAGSIITGLLSEYVRGLFEFGSIRV
jgi:4-hydroxybenzoate polyprenyltransferase